MSLEKIILNTSEVIRNFIDTCISILKITFFSKFNTVFPKAESGSCIILGNGPSLSQSLQKHPSFFKKHTLICVNNFVLSKEYTALQPSCYVMLDPNYWDTSDEVLKVSAALVERTTWKLYLLVPQRARNSYILKKIEQENKNIQIIFFNYTVFRGFTSIGHYFFRKNLAMPQSQNVLVASLFAGINIGFKTIHIVGADHTWHENLHVNEYNQLCIKDEHFYDNGTAISYRPFYTNAKRTSTFTMYEIFTTLAKAFLGYTMIKKYADHRGTTIYNASEISFIDAFERKKPEEQVK